MGITIISAPPEEPMSLAAAKAHLRVTSASEDSYIGSLISVARGYVESVTGRSLVARTVRWTIDAFPCGPRADMKLPTAPVQAIDSIVYTATDGTEKTWAAENYFIDDDGDMPALCLGYEKDWPSDVRDIRGAVKITMEAGYPPDLGSPVDYTAEIPEEIIHAMKLLIAHWHCKRQAASGDALTEIPMGVMALLARYKRAAF